MGARANRSAANLPRRKGFWTKDREDALLKQCAAEVEQAVAAYLATPAQQNDSMFDHLYAALPFAMQSQLEEARRFAPGDGRERQSAPYHHRGGGWLN